jgi:type II secretory pathway component PulK
MKRVWQILRERHQRRGQRDRQSGVALLVCISVLSLLIALVSEFTYQTTIYSAQAANARDEVRAHYLARSSIALSRLTIRIQQKFIDPIMNQVRSMLGGAQGQQGGAQGQQGQQAGGGELGFSLRITDYAGSIMQFFGGSPEEGAVLGSLIGLDLANAKGLGTKHGKIDAEITAEDGKIDINCGGGPTGNQANQRKVYQLLWALTLSPRYNSLFSRRNADGQFVDRADLARGIIDWADQDEQGYNFEAGQSGSEDYRYDARSDPYKAHNGFYDTAEEVGLVRGMDADFMEAFLPYLTVHSTDPQKTCRVNLASVKGDCTPLLVGLVRAAVQPVPGQGVVDPAVMDDNRIYPIASILCERGTAVGFDNINTIAQVMKDPAASIARDDPRYQLMQSMRGINVTPQQLGTVAYVGSPRVYKIVATGESGKVKKKITAIVDTLRGPDNPVTNNYQAEKASGVLQYWREE